AAAPRPPGRLVFRAQERHPGDAALQQRVPLRPQLLENRIRPIHFKTHSATYFLLLFSPRPTIYASGARFAKLPGAIILTVRSNGLSGGSDEMDITLTQILDDLRTAE